MNQLDFHGQKALVTGGTQGIGRAVTERLLRSGAVVYIWGLNPDRLVQVMDELDLVIPRASLGAVHGRVVDVREEEQVDLQHLMY